MHEVILYTDGACRGNPGPGGAAAVLLSGTRRKEIACGFETTTNQRMELMGLILGLEALRKRCRVRVFSDSKYVVNALNEGWLARWRARGWMRTAKKRVENDDLWRRLTLLLDRHEVEIEWTKGHAGTPENERCDQLAVAAAEGPGRVPDQGYADRLKRADAQGDLFI